jgi:hypothetical protein
MTRLRFDGESGRYVGPRLIVAGSAVSRRIRERTEAQIRAGVDPVDAAEEAWNAALDEASWRPGEDGVLVHPTEQAAPPGPHER